MTSKERVWAAFEHRQADRVPAFDQGIASDVASEILGREAYTGTTLLHYQEACAWMRGDAAHDEFVAQMTLDKVAIARELGFDMLTYPWRVSRRPAARPETYTIIYGDPDGDHSIYKFDPESKAFMHLEDVHATAPPPETPDDLEPQVEAAEARAEQPFDLQAFTASATWQFRADYGDEFEIPAGAGAVRIPLEPVWLMACALRPDLVERLLDAEMKRTLKAVDAMAGLGYRILWAGGDFADNHGPLYGPAVFRDIQLPRLQAVTRRAEERGMKYVFRTDGSLWDIADDFFVRSGIHGYGEIDYGAGMFLDDLVPRYGDRLTFWGNIECGGVLHRGTEQEVADTVKHMIDVAAPGGGYLFGSSNVIMPNTPARNVVAAYQTVREYGGY